ncbi:MAG TPA: circadian clock protein KaiC [archaeon]|nr:circadian clock protein KaiC [archaeon]
MKKPVSTTKGVPASQELPKARTYISGLDEVLRGGLPEGRTTLVSGGPGCGKSVLGLEFIYQGALNGEPGIFITFEESAAAVRNNARTLGWDLEKLEKEGRLFLMEGRVNSRVILSGDFNLKGLLAIIEGQARTMGARRVVLDSLDVILRLYNDLARESEELNTIYEWLYDKGLTSLITVKTFGDSGLSSRYSFLEFMSDCVILLDQRMLDQVATRRLRVLKYRGSGFGRNEYPCAITGDGFHLIPLSSMTLNSDSLGRKFSTGQPDFDEILGGGFSQGSSIILSGSTGTGKTTMACSTMLAACQRGERVLYINFEESERAMLENMLSPGIDLRPMVKAGLFRIIPGIPEAMGAEEHLLRFMSIIDEFKPDHLVVDAISSTRRMGSIQAAYEYLVRLGGSCKEKRITCFYINQTEGSHDLYDISGMGVSSFTDAIILLRFFDTGDQVRRQILVLKSRGTKHSSHYYEMMITDQGFELKPFRNVLGTLRSQQFEDRGEA